MTKGKLFRMIVTSILGGIAIFLAICALFVTVDTYTNNVTNNDECEQIVIPDSVCKCCLQ